MASARAFLEGMTDTKTWLTTGDWRGTSPAPRDAKAEVA
jgi:hypothetical protein